MPGVGPHQPRAVPGRPPLPPTVDTEAWKLEAEHIADHFQTFHRHLPARLWDLHAELAGRLASG